MAVGAAGGQAVHRHRRGQQRLGRGPIEQDRGAGDMGRAPEILEPRAGAGHEHGPPVMGPVEIIQVAGLVGVEHGVALVGPGDDGPFPSRHVGDGHWSRGAAEWEAAEALPLELGAGAPDDHRVVEVGSRLGGRRRYHRGHLLTESTSGTAGRVFDDPGRRLAPEGKLHQLGVGDLADAGRDGIWIGLDAAAGGRRDVDPRSGAVAVGKPDRELTRVAELEVAG